MSVEELYNSYKNQIYSLCFKLTGTRELAEELFSDTWARVAEKYTNINRDKKVFNWIYTITINIYRKKIAKLRNRAFTELQSVEEIEPPNNFNLEDSVISKEEHRKLQKCLQSLDDKYRLPLILFYFKDLSYIDIAKIMKLPISTVKYRLNRAKELLQKELEE